jgi:hypothetical protein
VTIWRHEVLREKDLLDVTVQDTTSWQVCAYRSFHPLYGVFGERRRSVVHETLTERFVKRHDLDQVPNFVVSKPNTV